MHCDDKRTIAALKQYILEATEEMQELKTQILLEPESKTPKIQERIAYLQKAIRDSSEQLTQMQ